MNQNPYSEALRLTGELADTWSPSSASATVPRAQSESRRQRAECAFAGCSSSWSRLLRRGGRPGFEGQWGCSRTCVRGLVAASLRRELADVDASASASPHRHRVPLGLVLLAQGWITHPQLQHALAAQKAAGRGRIGDWLVEKCGVEQMQVTRGLGVQWNRPVLSATGFDARRMALVMPSSLREKLGVMPLRVAADKILYVGFQDGVDATAGMALERMTGLTVEGGLMSGEDYRRSEVRLRERATVECKAETVENLDALTNRVAATLSTCQPVESRMVRIREQYWLRLWLEPGASGVTSLLPTTGEDVIDRLYNLRDSASSLS